MASINEEINNEDLPEGWAVREDDPWTLVFSKNEEPLVTLFLNTRGNYDLDSYNFRDNSHEVYEEHPTVEEITEFMEMVEANVN